MRTACGNEARDWDDATTSQRMPKTVSKSPEAGGGMADSPSQPSGANTADTLLLTSGL